MYVIYHIPGRKVGCTKDLVYREVLYEEMDGKKPDYAVLERLPLGIGDQGAGDREWEWADKLGLPRGPHYTITMHAVQVRGRNGAKRSLELTTSNQRSEWGKIGNQIRMETTTFEQWSAWGKISGKVGIQGLDRIRTPEQHSEWSRKAGRRRMELASPEEKVELGLIVGHMRATCPYCGFEGTIGPLHRWHFDNCRYKPKTSTLHFIRRAP